MRHAFALVVVLAGCGAPAAPSSGTSQTSTAAPQTATTCVFRAYAPSAGCYVDDSGLQAALTLADAGALAALLRGYPAEANRPPCDPEAEARAIDFVSERIFIASIRDADGVVAPEPVRVECTPDATRVVVSVDVWCGGTEKGPGRLMVVVPAGAAPIELVNEGRMDCPSYPGDPPP